MAGPRYRREIGQYRDVVDDGSVALKDLASTTGFIPSGWCPSIAKMGLPTRGGALDRDTTVEGVRMHVRTARLKFVMGHQNSFTARDDAGYTVPMMCAWVRGASADDPLTNTAKREVLYQFCLLYTSPSPRDRTRSRMPSSA